MTFLKDKYESVCENKENASEEQISQKWRKIRPNASGRIISDDDYLQELTLYLDSQNQETQHLKSTGKPKNEKEQASPKLSTSGLNQSRTKEASGIPAESETDSSFSCGETDRRILKIE